MLDLARPTEENADQKKPKLSPTYRDRIKRNFDRGTRERTFEIGQKVFVRNYRDGPKWFRGLIITKNGIIYLVRTLRGVWKRHADQLKPDLTVEDQPENESVDSDSDFDDQQQETEDEQNNGPAPPDIRRSQRTKKKPQIFDPSS
ncbi:hypothetical protein niasHT_033859 [Heterodera trifolii]|uniref:Uncharacterized protein n=1 Tax=Heterodera trifolii TaxID=157864 RepID=A0ABD2IDG3_9BILA